MAGGKGLNDLLLAGGRPRIRAVTFAPSELGNRRRPRRAARPGDVAEGASLAEARDLTESAIREFVRHAGGNKGKALLAATPPGTGKTRAVGGALRGAHAAARIVVGTTRLAREVAGDRCTTWTCAAFRDWPATAKTHSAPR